MLPHILLCKLLRYSFSRRNYIGLTIPQKKTRKAYWNSVSEVTEVMCWRQHVARSGYMLTVSRQPNYYSFMSRSTCIPLYPATDGQQTGNNFVADTRKMSTATCCRATCCPGVHAALGVDCVQGNWGDWGEAIYELPGSCHLSSPFTTQMGEKPVGVISTIATIPVPGTQSGQPTGGLSFSLVYQSLISWHISVIWDSCHTAK